VILTVDWETISARHEDQSGLTTVIHELLHALDMITAMEMDLKSPRQAQIDAHSFHDSVYKRAQRIANEEPKLDEDAEAFLAGLGARQQPDRSYGWRNPFFAGLGLYDPFAWLPSDRFGLPNGSSTVCISYVPGVWCDE
jgi:hypothetical protein